MAKLISIKNEMRVLIFNPIISEREHIFITKLLYPFFFLVIVYKGGQVLNISFNSGYIEIFIGRLPPSFAKNVLSLKGFPKTINNVFITNNFNVPASI